MEIAADGDSRSGKGTRGMFSNVLGVLWSDIAIDLGTANTLVYVPGQGIVLEEPSVVALVNRGDTREILAVGQEAKDMVGRTPDNIETIRPMRDGAIADFIAAEEMIKHFIRSTIKRRAFASPRVMICVPAGSTPVEKRAVFDAAHSAGAKKVYMISEPVAAAVGADLPVNEPRGSMVVDIGGGTTDIAVLSLGGVIFSRSLRIAGDAMDEAIINYVRTNHHLLVGYMSAEKIKMGAGTAIWKANGTPVDVHISGRNLRTGMPMDIVLGPADIAEALSRPVDAIGEAIQFALEELPPELASDIVERGIFLTGGGALLKNLDVKLGETTGVKFKIPDDPLRCVAIGTGRVLENLYQYDELLLDI